MKIIKDKEIIFEKLRSTEFIKFIQELEVFNVLVFGSLCNDDFNEFSDVDIALLGRNNISLNHILDVELFLEGFLEREIDVVDLQSDSLDIFLKANILNNGRIIYSKDNNKFLDEFCGYIHGTLKENEDYMHFRRIDVLS